MKLMWLRFAILRILNKIWPPEQPTTEELLGQINVLQHELQKYQERTYVWIDPTVYRTGAYDAPSPTTDGKMRAERMDSPQGVRERAMLHQWQENPGILSRLHTDMQRKKAQTVNLDPDTVMLPAATAPEDDWTNGGIDKTARHQAMNP